MATVDDGTGRNQTALAEYAAQMAGVVARLDAIHSEVTRLADHVAAQNGRIGKIETRQAAYDAMMVTGTKDHQEVDGRLNTLDARLKGLETYRDEATGMGKASLGILTQVLTIIALVISVYAIIMDHNTVHQLEPAAQHQAVK